MRAVRQHPATEHTCFATASAHFEPQADKAKNGNVLQRSVSGIESIKTF